MLRIRYIISVFATIALVFSLLQGISQDLPNSKQTIQKYSKFIRVDTVFQVFVKDTTARKSTNKENIGFTNNSELNFLLKRYNVTKYEQALPWVSSGILCDLYEVECHGNIDELISDIQKYFPEMFFEIKRLDYEIVSQYEPSDYLWHYDPDWLWHLRKIQADSAWNITLGDPNVKVAVIDTDFDVTHPDLCEKIYPLFDPYDSVPFTCETNGSRHGTIVAGFVAGETTEQGEEAQGQLASVGFKTMMIAYRGQVENYLQRAHHASSVMKANIIVSAAGGWTSCPAITSMSDSLIVKDILDNGTTIIMPAGNGNNGSHNECPAIDPLHHIPYYPLSPFYDERIIIVSSTGKDDKHLFTDEPENTHSHYPSVDLCAPGYRTMSILPTDCGSNSWPYYGDCNGTSFAAPIVAGVAALMYSVNPDLTPEWCQDILKNTTDPIVDAVDFPNGVGTGRVNAFKAVVAAQQSYSSTLDLYIKDRPEDFGNEQNPYDWQLERDKSPDIWVRNQQDGLKNQKHQEPEYNSNNPVYVYVRVHNKSGVAATGNEELSLYWTKASSCSSWPNNWDGSDPTIGDKIGTVNLNNLASGRDTIIEFAWHIINPHIHQNWSTCLLARIENSLVDPITIYPERLDKDVYFNNNIAMRNVVIKDILIDSPPLGWENDIFYPHGCFIYVGNVMSEPCSFNISFTAPTEIDSSSIISQAEVKIIFDEIGWNIFAEKLEAHPSVSVLREKEVLMRGNQIELTDVHFPENLRVPIYVGFSFYVQDDSECAQYQYYIKQKMTSDNSPLGGVYFTINRNPRPSFQATIRTDRNKFFYGDKILLSADLIDEPAEYNWYDENGIFIHTGNTLVVSPDHSQKYKLEVIAMSDGVKDYDEVYLNLQNQIIESIYPIPIKNQMTIKYKTDNTNSAKIIISNSLGSVLYRQPINVHRREAIFNLSGYSAGLYRVSLECDGKIVDKKTIVIY